ncbi:MAG: lytic transglycosylase domain-containing protein [Actinobacteria bacterium]|nr:lytic transglycosylase domain-containing protein [Actinomycetota bacterium]
MGPAAIGDVTSRIAAIERRFAPPGASFDATLRSAVAGAALPTAGRGAPGMVPFDASPGGAATAAPAFAAPGAPTGGFAGDWARRLPPAGRAWAPSIERAALRAGIEPTLLASLVWAESGFQPTARSHAGAIGLAQLMPGTAAGLGVDPHDPEQNLDGGARFLAEQLRRFGRSDLALAAYNAGPGRVERAGGIPAIAETQAYVPKVLGYYQRLRGAG